MICIRIMRYLGSTAAGLALRIVVLFPIAMMVGCGASSLRLHAQAADTIGSELDIAGSELLSHRADDLTAAAHAGTTREEAEAAIATATAHWAPVLAAEELAAAAQRAYADAVVELAADRSTEGHLIALLGPLARAYGACVASLTPLGIHLPPLPDVVTQLLGGSS